MTEQSIRSADHSGHSTQPAPATTPKARSGSLRRAWRSIGRSISAIGRSRSFRGGGLLGLTLSAPQANMEGELRF